MCVQNYIYPAKTESNIKKPEKNYFSGGFNKNTAVFTAITAAFTGF